MEDTTTEVIHHEQQATEFEKYVVSMSLSLDLDRQNEIYEGKSKAIVVMVGMLENANLLSVECGQ